MENDDALQGGTANHCDDSRSIREVEGGRVILEKEQTTKRRQPTKTMPSGRNRHGKAFTTKKKDSRTNISRNIGISRNEETKTTRISTAGASELQHAEDRIAVSETRLVVLLRCALVIILVALTLLVSLFVYRMTKHDERDRFENFVHEQSSRIVESINHSVSMRLGAINAMATAITSHARATQQVFPFVTVPDFEVRGSALRVLAESHVIHYMPVVSDANRIAWENYALEHRSQIEDAFTSDAQQRTRQDEQLHFNTRRRRRTRQVQEMNDANNNDNKNNRNETILNDGTGYHPRIWSNGAITPRGDEADEAGPFLPLWQRR